MLKSLLPYPAILLLCLLVWLSAAGPALAQGTVFTYQGQLIDSGNPANGVYDFQFKLFDTVTVGTGTQFGSTVTSPTVQVTAGIFTVQLDFGLSAFPGAARYLEIAVKQTSGSTFTTLSPRQPLTSNPYAIRSLNSVTADGLSQACVGCITSSQIQTVQGSQVTGSIAGSQISGAIPVASVPAGSANYIQNGASQQAATNFNVSDTGTANILNATTQFNLGGNRILSTTGTDNLFAGINAGAANMGFGNAFFGKNAGQANTERYNSLFGFNAGVNTTTGCCNSLFGNFVGFSNTIGRSNAFFGGSAGFGNTEGSFNAFFGDGAGYDFFTSTGNTTGVQNTFVGYLSGRAVTTGSNNTFLGSNTTGATNLDHATAIGADTSVSTSNTVVLGRNVDTVQIPGLLNVSATLGANIFNATSQFNIGGTRVLGNAGTNNLFAGVNAGAVNTGFSNSFFGNGAGAANMTGGGNAFFGRNAGLGNTTGSNITIIGTNANVSANGLDHATAVGADAVVGTSNTLMLGRAADTVQVPGALNVTATAGANILNATTQFNLGGSRILSTPGSGNLFMGFNAGASNTGTFNSLAGVSAGQANTTGSSNSLFGSFSGSTNMTGSDNSYFGASAGSISKGSGNSFFGSQAGANGAGFGNGNTFIGQNADIAITQSTGNNNTVLGANAKVDPITNGTVLNFASAIGAGARVNFSDMVIIGKAAGTYDGVVRPADIVRISGLLQLLTFGPAGGSPLCFNNGISMCSSSLRYKTNVQPYFGGLDLLNRLKPITYTWKSNGQRDLGFGAEQVAEVEPLLTFKNDKGEIEGVKYSQLSAVFVNAFKQQQSQIKAGERQAARQQEQIEQYRKQLTRQQSDLDSLKRIVCLDHHKAAICKTTARASNGTSVKHP